MLGGKLLLKTKADVPGSFKQLAYQDVWEYTIDIDYDGDLKDAAVQKKITDAFYKSKVASKGSSSYGALRWSSPDHVKGIDVENKKLIVSASINICD